MDKLDEIFVTLRAFGHCADQQDFSRSWLGRSASYYAHLRSTRKPCSLASLGMLAGLIRETQNAAAARSANQSGGDDHQRHHCGDDQPDDARSEEWRRLGAAWIAAETMFRGEWELMHARPSERVTAIALPDWIDATLR